MGEKLKEPEKKKKARFRDMYGTMHQQQLSRKEYSFRGIFGFFFLFLLWSLITYTGLVKPFFIPTPSTVVTSIITLFMQFNLLYDIFISVYRIIIGFVLAAIVAVPLGVFVGSIKKVEAYIEPFTAFVRYIPPSAFVPLSILWFGVGDIQKFFIIFIGVAPYLLIMVADVVANVKQEFIEAGYTLGATPLQAYTRIIVPCSMPGIWDAMRVMIGAAWTFIIFVEIIASTSGLGHVIIQSQRFLQTANVMAVIIIIGILGLMTDFLFKICYKKLFPWSEKVR